MDVFFQGQTLYWTYLRMVGPIDVKRKGGALVGCWVNYVTLTFDLTHDLHLWIFKVKFQNSCIWGIVIWLMWNKKKANQLDTGLTVWSCPLNISSFVSVLHNGISCDCHAFTISAGQFICKQIRTSSTYLYKRWPFTLNITSNPTNTC